MAGCKKNIKRLKCKEQSRNKRGWQEMNFNNKRTRRIIAIVIMVIIIAMVATSIIPSIMV